MSEQSQKQSSAKVAGGPPRPRSAPGTFPPVTVSHPDIITEVTEKQGQPDSRPAIIWTPPARELAIMYDNGGRETFNVIEVDAIGALVTYVREDDPKTTHYLSLDKIRTLSVKVLD